jgi:hypothetical protein
MKSCALATADESFLEDIMNVLLVAHNPIKLLGILLQL